MGLLDVINGMQNGPRGQPQPGTGARGGMSPITMALMGLLAYKAIKGFSSRSAGASPATGGTSTGEGEVGTSTGTGGGSLGGLLSGGLGSLLGGGSTGSGLGGLFGGASTGNVLSGGLGNLVKDLEDSGHGGAVQSWIGNGPNQPISPAGLESAIGSDTIDKLAQQTGMNKDELLNAVSQYLPGLVDHLTPNGRLPTEAEAARMS